MSTLRPARTIEDINGHPIRQYTARSNPHTFTHIWATIRPDEHGGPVWTYVHTAEDRHGESRYKHTATGSARDHDHALELVQAHHAATMTHVAQWRAAHDNDSNDDKENDQ